MCATLECRTDPTGHEHDLSHEDNINQGGDLSEYPEPSDLGRADHVNQGGSV